MPAMQILVLTKVCRIKFIYFYAFTAEAIKIPCNNLDKLVTPK